LTIWTEAHVEKLTLKKDEQGQLACKGVQVIVKGVKKTVIANVDTILSAGAINSPHILQLSGIGDPNDLKAQGIDVQHELVGVGKNLQDHLQLRTIFRVENVKTLNQMNATLWGKAAIGLEYLLKRSGPMSMAPSQLGVFTKSSPEQEHSNVQFHVQPLSLEAFGDPLHPWPGMTVSVCNLNPSSRGTVTLKSPDAHQGPAISLNYLSTQEDKQVAADSIRVARRVMEQHSLLQYKPEEIKPGVEFQTDKELADVAGNIGTTIFHPVGTTRMGRVDDDQAVVDSHLRVRGVSGLRVVDAGVMPNITSGNTNSPTLMIAEKAARWIAKSV
jgi:choline dehydrogenase